MEAAHFVAGPWFTVVPSSDDWHPIARITLSDAERTEPATVELRLRFAEPDADTFARGETP